MHSGIVLNSRIEGREQILLKLHFQLCFMCYNWNTEGEFHLLLLCLAYRNFCEQRINPNCCFRLNFLKIRFFFKVQLKTFSCQKEHLGYNNHCTFVCISVAFPIWQESHFLRKSSHFVYVISGSITLFEKEEHLLLNF